VISDHFIETINSKAKTWQAGRNFHPLTSTNYLKTLMGVHPDHREYLPPQVSILHRNIFFGSEVFHLKMGCQ
jgi:hypothetical protein